ncbi:DsbA family protein [Klebsiella pneumoniae]|uniref:DsbA family protein n=1 Tax=Klebsiella pneumoniae TaxID=573 RepID=UPI003A5CCC1B
MKSLMPRISVDVWSDYVCPWCWIAKNDLKRVLKSLNILNRSMYVITAIVLRVTTSLFHSDRLCIRSLVVSMAQS